MSNVIEFKDRFRNGDEVFLACSCSPNELTVTPIVILDPNKAIVTRLVCSKCDTESFVINGVIENE